MMMNFICGAFVASASKDISFYSPKMLSENRTVWEDKFKQFVDTGIHPESLVAAENIRENIFIF